MSRPANHPPSIHILQINQNDDHIAAEKTIAFLHRFNSSISPSDHQLILLIQEPYYWVHGSPSCPKNYTSFYIHTPASGASKALKARTLILCPQSLTPQIVGHFSTRDTVMVRILFDNRAVLLISCYFPDKQNPANQLKSIDPAIRCDTILGGDINLKHPLWGSPSVEQHALLVEEFALSHSLSCLNHNKNAGPSFQSSRGSSFIDASFASYNLCSALSSWEQLPIDALSSDHTAFLFSFQGSQRPPLLPNAPSIIDLQTKQNTEQ